MGREEDHGIVVTTMSENLGTPLVIIWRNGAAER